MADIVTSQTIETAPQGEEWEGPAYEYGYTWGPDNVLVPREPTEAMLLAGMCAKPDHPDQDNTLARHERIVKTIYTAMLGAAAATDAAA